MCQVDKRSEVCLTWDAKNSQFLASYISSSALSLDG